MNFIISINLQEEKKKNQKTNNMKIPRLLSIFFSISIMTIH